MPAPSNYQSPKSQPRVDANLVLYFNLNIPMLYNVICTLYIVIINPAWVCFCFYVAVKKLVLKKPWNTLFNIKLFIMSISVRQTSYSVPPFLFSEEGRRKGEWSSKTSYKPVFCDTKKHISVSGWSLSHLMTYLYISNLLSGYNCNYCCGNMVWMR